MVKVASSQFTSKDAFVQIEIYGIAEVQRRLQALGHVVWAGVDSATLEAANMVQSEVQSSIIGIRDEPKSVDTGRFGNGIVVDKLDKAVYTIKPEGTYPNGQTVANVATILENHPKFNRKHFRNSLNRKETEVKEKIAQAVRNAAKKF